MALGSSEHDGGDPAALTIEDSQHVKPAFFRHEQIEQQNVRMFLLYESQGFRAIASLAGYLEARLSGEQGGKGLAQDGVIVGDNDLDIFGHEG